MKTREERRMMLAGMAMQGLCANSKAQIPVTAYAESAVSFADALLAELDRTAPKPETPIPDADGWIPHRPGDAMPCGSMARVFVKMRGEDIESALSEYLPGDAWDWSSSPDLQNQIIAWKPAK